MPIDKKISLGNCSIVLVFAAFFFLNISSLSANERENLLSELFEVNGINGAIDLTVDTLNDQKKATKEVVFKSFKNDLRNFCCLNIDDEEINAAIDNYLASSFFDNIDSLMRKAYIKSFASFKDDEIKELIKIYNNNLSMRATEEVLETTKYINDYMTSYFANEYPHKIEELKRDLRDSLARRES